jgi:hypothetical protein
MLVSILALVSWMLSDGFGESNNNQLRLRRHVQDPKRPLKQPKTS